MTLPNVFIYTFGSVRVSKLHRSGEIRCSNSNTEADSSLLGFYNILACKKLPSHVT
jgi:hypothetical protein